MKLKFHVVSFKISVQTEKKKQLLGQLGIIKKIKSRKKCIKCISKLNKKLKQNIYPDQALTTYILSMIIVN